MRSPEAKQGAFGAKPDLYSRSYSPTLRVLVVGAIFLVAVFVLAACGSSGKPRASSISSTNGATTSAVTPSSVPTATQAALLCHADKSSDSLDVGKYFGGILTQVRSQWKSDAVISSVRFQDPAVKTFQDLCMLKTDSNWQIVFYSLSTKNEISGYLDNSKKNASGVPPVTFNVDKIDNSASTGLTYVDMKKQGGWKFHEFSRPETFALESKYAANMFLNWKMSMSDVVQKLIDRVRTEKITGSGFYIYVSKVSLKTKSPSVSIYWQNGTNGTSFYVEPITLTSYDVKS